VSAKDPRTEVAFALLAYERYGRVLRHYLMNRVRNYEDARELAQEVWTRLLRVTEPQKVLDPRGYIYRVAAHVVAEFQHLRRRDPVQFDSEAFAVAVEDAAPADDVIERLNMQRDAVRALQPLSPMFRTIVVLRIREGLSYSEIGERLNLTTTTAERYFFTAMAQARIAWARRAR
jgi:RNA polymerase sigma-70 factor (ECF subfamily)